VGNAFLEGTIGSFDLNGFHFDLIIGEIVAEVAKSDLALLPVGFEFFNDISLLGAEHAFGVGTIRSVVDPPEFGQVTISVLQLEASRVPVPATLLLVAVGLALLVGVIRVRSERKAESLKS
jgi:hypothetical protein